MADPANSSSTADLLALTAQIVAAHVAGNKVAVDALPDLIRSVHDALARTGIPAAEKAQVPAVPIKRSIYPDYLVCLEDGTHVQVLTRYLKRFGLTPDTYRAKWDLPRNYPMVAPAYTAKRSDRVNRLSSRTALRTVEPSAPEAPHLPIEVEEPTVPAPEPEHTAASVFANFPGAEVPAENAPAANDAGRTGRRRFSQQSMRLGRRRV